MKANDTKIMQAIETIKAELQRYHDEKEEKTQTWSQAVETAMQNAVIDESGEARFTKEDSLTIVAARAEMHKAATRYIRFLQALAPEGTEIEIKHW